jgi:hypothetical protein
MRCLACDKALTDYEATRRFNESKEFVDLCNHCFYSGVNDEVYADEREDLEELEETNG